MSGFATLLARARAAGWRIATAESCTGGLLSGAITDLPGSSEIFDRGFVTYSNAAKRQMLGVRDATLAAYGAVSVQVAQEMAEGALSRSDAQMAVSITGVAGPGGSAAKPEGMVCFALARHDVPTRTHQVEFGALGRAEVRRASVDHALEMLLSGLPAQP